jgi:hypothetical protein
VRIAIKGKIKSMQEHERGGESFVSVHLQPEGSVDSAKGPDAKKAHSDMYVYVKPLIAQELKFGQELFVSISTEPPVGSDDRIYCYHCGGKLDRKGPRDCPVCS